MLVGTLLQETFLRSRYLFMYRGYYRYTKFVIMDKIIFFAILSCTYNHKLDIWIYWSEPDYKILLNLDMLVGT